MGLGVQIEQANPLPLFRERRAEINCRGGFPNTPFLIHDRNGTHRETRSNTCVRLSSACGLTDPRHDIGSEPFGGAADYSERSSNGPRRIDSGDSVKFAESLGGLV